MSEASDVFAAVKDQLIAAAAERRASPDFKSQEILFLDIPRTGIVAFCALINDLACVGVKAGSEPIAFIRRVFTKVPVINDSGDYTLTFQLELNVPSVYREL